MAVIGYGDIGAACARIAKHGFGMKVTGVKRDPKAVTAENRSYCDEVVGNDSGMTTETKIVYNLAWVSYDQI